MHYRFVACCQLHRLKSTKSVLSVALFWQATALLLQHHKQQTTHFPLVLKAYIQCRLAHTVNNMFKQPLFINRYINRISNCCLFSQRTIGSKNRCAYCKSSGCRHKVKRKTGYHQPRSKEFLIRGYQRQMLPAIERAALRVTNRLIAVSFY